MKLTPQHLTSMASKEHKLSALLDDLIEFDIYHKLQKLNRLPVPIKRGIRSTALKIADVGEKMRLKHYAEHMNRTATPLMKMKYLVGQKLRDTFQPAWEWGYQKWSAKPGDLIEFRSIMDPEMVSQVFGRGSSFRNLRKVAGGTERVSPLQKVLSQNGINRINPAIPAPGRAGSSWVAPLGPEGRMATGAPKAAAATPPPPKTPQAASTAAGGAASSAAGTPPSPGKAPWWRKNVGRFAIGAGTAIAGGAALSAWMNSGDRNQQYSSRLKGTIDLSDWLDGIIIFQDRNPITGQFTPPGSEGPDANAMATVYKLPQMQQQMPQGGLSAGKAAGAAVAGGALGAIGSQAGKAGYNKTAELIRQLAAKRRKKL